MNVQTPNFNSVKPEKHQVGVLQLSAIRDFPAIGTLTPQEEESLVQSGDQEQLVLRYMREAFIYGFRVSRGGLEEGEIVSACYLALRDAARNFRPEKCTKAYSGDFLLKGRFFSYAKVYIRGRVIAEFRAKDVVRRVRNSDSLDDSYGRRQVRNRSDECADTDFYGPLETDFQEPDLEHAKEEVESMQPIIDRVLNEKEKMILQLRYKGGLNFRQIGALLGVSRSNMQNEHRNALKKIRNELLTQKRLFNR